MSINQQKQFEIVSCLELGDAQVYNHLMPLALHPDVSKIWIVRSHESRNGGIPKSEYVLTPGRSKLLRLIKMFRICRRLARRPQVKAFVSFNPIPYGMISATAARPYNKSIHYGFIGSDWYRNVKGRFGPLLRPMLKKADFFTATGPAMKREMVNYGFDEDRISVLPHSIDLDKFKMNNPCKAEYSFIFVGQLIRLKRVDLILRAFAEVLQKHPEAKLCIVGEGPLRQELNALTAELGIKRAVDFTGYRTDVPKLLQQAKIMVMASDREGFPFALVEAMCSGLVPVSTTAGTVKDLVKHKKNGLLIPTCDLKSLAQSMFCLLSDDGLYSRLRKQALQSRTLFSYVNAMDIWDLWFSRIY